MNIPCGVRHHRVHLWDKETATDLPRVVVPQLLVQAVGVSLLPLDLGDDVEDVGVGAAGAGAPLAVRLAVRLAAAVA